MTEALQQEIRTLRSLLDSERDPGGRVFAPLADAYRRAGRIPEALRLLNEGRAKHPDFVTGHVVAAQLYVEQGLGAEGKLAARRALELDGENVVALGALLQVLEESGEVEAGDVRDRLTALEPGFALKAAPTAEAPPVVVREPREEPASPDAQTVPMRALDRSTPTAGAVPEAFEMPPPLRQPAIPADAIDLAMLAPLPAAALPLSALAPEIAPVDMKSDFELPTLVPDEEPMMDLPLLAPEPADEEPVTDLAMLAPEPADEEPAMDLALLAPEPADEEPMMDLALLAPEPADEEPVMDLALLAPEPADEEPAMDLALLAPEPADEEPVMDLALLAPEPADEEPVMDLALLAPEPADEEPVMDLALLAPEPADEEPVMDLALLAPEPADEDPVMDLALLAPEPEDEDPVMDLALLAPEPADEEPVMDLAMLAPEPADEEPVMDLAMLAPEPADEGAVMDLAALAPEPDTVVDLGTLAPDEDVVSPDALAPAEVTARDASPAPELLGFDEPVFDLDALAPSISHEEGATPVVVAPAPPAEDAVDVAFLSPDRPDEIVIDLDALRPEGAPASPLPAESAAAAAVVDAPSSPPTVEASEPPAEISEREEVAQPAAQPEEEGEPVYTRTLAELYASQGAARQAVEVLRRILAENPADQEVARRVEQLEAGERQAPVAEEEEVETLARDLAESGANRHDVESPFAWAERESEATPEVEGPTIREYFDGMLGWEPREGA